MLWLVGIPATASADAAAGRRAYDQGDYGRAMMEWQEAADHGDPDAEFGLGNLFEFGTGYLQQNYARAAYWYKKAAGHGNTEAQYRLALIYGAGGDDFPSNLTEAYKWATLAARSQGVWGTLAGNFERLLDQVTSARQRTEGEKLAAAWSQARAAETAPAKKDESRVDAAPLPPGIAAAGQGRGAGKGMQTGCPGWPFPTLPCTEEFPALAGTPAPPRTRAGAAPPAAPKPAIEELDAALARVDCAALRGTLLPEGGTLIVGTVANLAEKARLVQLAARFFPDNHPRLAVAVVPPPLCRSLATIVTIRRSVLAVEGGLGLTLGGGGARLREGDRIRIEVRAPAYPVDLRLDYFALDGRVLHLLPDGGAPPPRVAAGATRLFGDPASGEDWRAGGAPFGTELIAAIASAAPLDLGDRPRVEAAADYLRALAAALDRAKIGADTPNRVATLLVETSGR